MADPVMPTEVELQTIFGGSGPGGHTKSTVAQMLVQDQKSRMMRQSQVKETCQVNHWEECIFDAESTELVSQDWIDFANVKFTAEPSFSTGSKVWNIDQNDEDAVYYPAVAMLSSWRKDERGYYTGAKCRFFVYGAPPEGYKVMVSCSWSGPAIRSGT